MKVLTFTYVREDFVDMYPVGENLDCGIKYINKVYPILKKIVKNKSINLWCTGSSGLILATLLMTKLYKNKTLWFKYYYRWFYSYRRHC